MGYLFIFFSLVCFVLLCQSVSSSFVHHLCSPSEASALLQFNQFFEISPPGRCYKASFPKTISWNESTDCCTWEGVTCDMLTGYVIGLDLSCSFLRGTIHPNSSLFQLYHLQSLNLARNDFNWSSFPNDIGRLRNLKYLNLRECDFSGSIPDSIGNLTQMRQLDFGDNHFTGHIPSTISKLKQLILLDLWSNSLGGEIPDIFSNFQVLADLVLSNNRFTGSFPPSILSLTCLQRLDLSSNSLSGPLPSRHLEQLHFYNLNSLDLKFNFLQGPLPSSICKMSSLSFLDLSHNYFTDSVPHCLGNMDSLFVLDLRSNSFRGSLPTLCSRTTSHLRTIVLNGNQFEGPVPMSLLNCNSLEILDVGNNSINGTFPTWLGSLQQLQVLILKSNKFYGPISACQTEFCFPMLRILDVSRNEFNGSLLPQVFRNFRAMIKLDDTNKGTIKYMEPHLDVNIRYIDSVKLVIKGQDIDLERITTIMTVIDLSSNHFDGVIPKALKDLSSLWLLNLSHNDLRGDIPTELGQMNTLEALDLSWNWLTGKIPRELTRLEFLAVFNLSQNVLVGPIPQGSQFNTFSNDSYGGNLDLCGPPLSKKCGMSDASHVPQPLESEEEDDESYFASGFTWESVVIGYSCGLVVGTVMFKSSKPKWFLEGIIPLKNRRRKKRGLR
uniref:Leucine-rich repeat-containing N-terminal plant-type domain-containing protein n=1 Tax=Solanum lycopersicum TaxID=4081 RepID=A0A3Q7G284_SOLLC